MFGASAVPAESTQSARSIWHEAPQYEEVRKLFTAVGTLKAKIEILEIEISEQEREIKRGSRKADLADDAKEATKDKRRELAGIRAELHVAECELNFFQFHKEIFKSVTFATR